MSGSKKYSSNPLNMTSRQFSVIQIILQSAPAPVTVKTIAEKLNVSSRTILRELPVIENWFQAREFLFERKPSVGISIPESPENLQIIGDLLEAQKVQKVYGRQERQRHIIGELLFAKEPVKSYTFLSKFHISEGTLSGDLDSLNEWFKDYGIRIIRRPGAGILLEGAEAAYRKAIVSAAFEFLDEGDILNMIRGDEDEKKPESKSVLHDRLSGVIEPEMIAFTEHILSDTEEQLDIRYTDSGYMALVVHLSLAIRRIQAGEKINMDAEELERLRDLPEHYVAGKIAERVSKRFCIEVPEAEVGYITMHLSSARIWPKIKTSRGHVSSVDAHQVVMKIVHRVEQKTRLPFHTCTRMIQELTSHVESMLSRLALDVHSSNAKADMVRDSYPEIYQAVEEACDIFQELLGVEKVSQTEVALVAMHFAASAEMLQAEQSRILIAVVCPSGMGGSRVLAANLMRAFPNLEIRQVHSAIRIEPDELKKNGIELVISTVPLQLDFPVVCVNPILQQEDHQSINQAVEMIISDRVQSWAREDERDGKSSTLTMDTIISLTRTGKEMQELIEHFKVRCLSGECNAETFLGQAAELFADDSLNRSLIRTTFLPEMKICLLHCRTAAVQHCRFGYLRLETPVSTEKGLLQGAVVMLAPQKSEEAAEVIGQMSTLLAEDEKFLQALQSGDEQEGISLAQRTLVRFYETKIKAYRETAALI